MITVTMQQALDFRKAYIYFNGIKLPLKAAYKLTKIKQAIEKETEYYGQKFQEIVDTYAQKDENGNLKYNEDGTQIMIKDGMVMECNQKLEELHNLEIGIENYNLTIDDLGEGIEVTVDDLDALMPFFS
jgi:uncharacterized metal-binding protein